MTQIELLEKIALDVLVERVTCELISSLAEEISAEKDKTLRFNINTFKLFPEFPDDYFKILELTKQLCDNLQEESCIKDLSIYTPTAKPDIFIRGIYEIHDDKYC
jgi:hypothetical protein